ncbi:MAG: putative immunity protein [Actinomycetales bacterium]
MSRTPNLALTDRRSLARWAHACVSPVVHVFWEVAPADDRPADAVDAIAEFAAGRIGVADLRSAARGAREAATLVDGRAAAVATLCARAAAIGADAAQSQALGAELRDLMPELDEADAVVVRHAVTRQLDLLPRRLRDYIYAGQVPRRFGDPRPAPRGVRPRDGSRPRTNGPSTADHARLIDIRAAERRSLRSAEVPARV